MLGRCVTIFSIIILQLAQKGNGLQSCDTNSSESRFLRIRVNSMKDDLGLWRDTFHTKAEHSDTLRDVSVDVKHNISQCSGRRIIEIQGVIQNGNYTIDAAVDSDADEVVNQQTPKVDAPALYFHHKHGRNIVVSNNRRTVEKNRIEAFVHGSAFTNRPIEADELFEVRMYQIDDRYYSGIGILNKDPEEVEILAQMYRSEYVWMYRNRRILSANMVVKGNYGQSFLVFPVNTTFGVMKKPSGDIHFYVNGLDQGPAVSGISDPVYGVIELGYNAYKATIVKP